MTERACPFCAVTLALAPRPSRPMPTQRLGRAALFAFGAAVATSAGCSEATTRVDDAGSDVGGADAGRVDAHVAPPIDADTDAGRDAATPPDAAFVFDPCADAAVFAMYGAAPPCDSGAAVDANYDDVWGLPLYGAPPAPPEP